MSDSEEDLLDVCYFPSSIAITEEIPEGDKLSNKKHSRQTEINDPTKVCM